MPRTRFVNDELYQEHHKLIWDRVHRWAQKTGRDIRDLIGPAHEGFMKAVATFDPERGARFGTHLYRVVNQHIIKYIQKVDQPLLSQEEEEELSIGIGAFEEVAIRDEIRILSEEARYVVMLVFEESYQGLSPRAIRGEIAQLLREEGWSSGQIQGSFREIRRMLRPSLY